VEKFVRFLIQTGQIKSEHVTLRRPTGNKDLLIMGCGYVIEGRSSAQKMKMYTETCKLRSSGL